MAVAAAALTAPLLAGPVAHADVPPLPLPVDLNCTFTYGVQSVQYVDATHSEVHYGGSTSCSRKISYMASQAYAPPADYGPYHSCGPCDSTQSHSSFTATDGTSYTMYYDVWLVKANSTFGASWPPDCRTYSSKHGLYCHFPERFVIVNSSAPAPAEITQVGADPLD